MLWGNNGLNHDGMEVGGFCFSGGLVGGLSLCGSHWDCFLSWDTMGAAVGIFTPEGCLDTKQTRKGNTEGMEYPKTFG